MKLVISQIKQWIRERKYLVASHAKLRMIERGITTSDMEKVIIKGKIIEEYQDDEPCPSVLILGYLKKKPLHVVIGICKDHLRIITAYIPSHEKWIKYQKRRNIK